MHISRLIAYNKITDNPFHGLDGHNSDYAAHFMVLYRLDVIKFIVAPDGVPKNTVTLYSIIEYGSYLVYESLPVV